MRRFQLVSLALLSFLAVTCGSFCDRLVTLTLCAILGIESPAGILLNASPATAAPPPTHSQLAQIDIFSPSPLSTPANAPPVDIFSPNPNTPPPSPFDPGSNFTRPEFGQSRRIGDRSNQSRAFNLSGRWAFQDSSKPMFGAKRVNITQMGDRLVVTLVSGNWGELSNQNAKLDGKLSDNQVFIHWPIGRAVTPSTGYYGTISSDGKIIKGEFRSTNPMNGETIRDDPFTMTKL